MCRWSPGQASVAQFRSKMLGGFIRMPRWLDFSTFSWQTPPEVSLTL